MSKPVGGRGHSAPYKSTHVRVPEPIKDRVETLKKLYFSGDLEEHDKLIIENSKLAKKYREINSEVSNKNESKESKYKKEELLALVKDILKQKKSARVSMQKLLTALLCEDISLEDLK